MTFKNKQLSRFGFCPSSFELNYVEKREAEFGPALRFGKAPQHLWAKAVSV